MKDVKNYLLIMSIVLIVVLTIALIQKPKEIEKVVYKESKCDVSKTKSVNQKDNYILLGDSITDWYPTEIFFDKEIPLVRSGVAGYQTKDVLNELDEMVIKYNPTKVFILIGTNDVEGVKKEVILSNIEKIVVEIKEKRPHTEIYFESILPVNTTDTEKVNLKTVGKRDNNYIMDINSNIKKICKEQKINYLDLYPIFADNNNQLNSIYTKDGLHLNELGYFKLTQVLLEKM